MATSSGLIPFRCVADEILAVHGQIHRLAQPVVVPWTPPLPHVEEAKHRHESAAVFHHFGIGALSHL